MESSYGPGLLPVQGSFHFKGYSPPPMWYEYGGFLGIFLLFLKSTSLLAIPMILSHLFGLVLYETFPVVVKRRTSPLMSPFICFRVVTRGDYPDLVRSNLEKNIDILKTGGVTNFMMEVVTDKALNLPSLPRFRELVVPTSYKTSTGAKFKSRALQYCLESEVNCLQDDDWIVHLDEETLLTENVVSGILNFTSQGDNDIGQGLITYASNEIVNWFTTLADSFRVAADLGCVRFTFNAFRKAVFIFKGSFVVTRFKAEKAVGFDNGPAGSIAEDVYFAMKAWSQGYNFGWIEGEMHEKSPFNILDFFQQKKRWLQGQFLVVHCPLLPLYTRFGLGLGLYTWLTLPVTLANAVLVASIGVSLGTFFDYFLTLAAAVGIYMYVFGAVRSFRLSRLGLCKYLICLVGSVAMMPINAIIESLAVIFGLLQDKHKFYIVKKQFHSTREELV